MGRGAGAAHGASVERVVASGGMLGGAPPSHTGGGGEGEGGGGGGGGEGGGGVGGGGLGVGGGGERHGVKKISSAVVPELASTLHNTRLPNVQSWPLLNVFMYHPSALHPLHVACTRWKVVADALSAVQPSDVVVLPLQCRLESGE